MSPFQRVQIRLKPEQHRALADIAREEGRSVYDAHYLAVAEEEGAVLWTADRRLANGARRAGAVRVQWIGPAGDAGR